MLTDGGDSVRALAGVMAPGAVPVLDWFHIAMRLTGLGQYTKGLAHHNPVEATALEIRLERIKWRFWHGDAGEALTWTEQLAADVAAQNPRRHAARPVLHLVSGLGCQRQSSPGSRHCGLNISQALTRSPPSARRSRCRRHCCPLAALPDACSDPIRFLFCFSYGSQLCLDFLESFAQLFALGLQLRPLALIRLP